MAVWSPTGEPAVPRAIGAASPDAAGVCSVLSYWPGTRRRPGCPPCCPFVNTYHSRCMTQSSEGRGNIPIVAARAMAQHRVLESAKTSSAREEVTQLLWTLP
eukprot:223416-Prorocentrum_minimum.AAC.2